MALAAILALGLISCGEEQKSVKAEDYRTIPLKYPNGKVIRVEQMINRDQVNTGMMFRDSLAPDRGMLFYHGREMNRGYWMFQVEVPLDLVWLDKNKRVVQIVHKAPPCPGPSNTCPSYGGAFPAAYVLEVPAGSVAANGLKPGMQLEF